MRKYVEPSEEFKKPSFTTKDSSYEGSLELESFLFFSVRESQEPKSIYRKDEKEFTR
jgi:hypothetical protein